MSSKLPPEDPGPHSKRYVSDRPARWNGPPQRGRSSESGGESGAEAPRPPDLAPVARVLGRETASKSRIQHKRGSLVPWPMGVWDNVRLRSATVEFAVVGFLHRMNKGLESCSQDSLKPKRVTSLVGPPAAGSL